jgi:subtilisin family serine protease
MPVRIAIIDSGVHADHPHINGVAGGIGIDSSGREHADFVDRLGHGTAVTAVIREKAPAAEVFAIKVFDRELAATAAALVAACDWAARHSIHIVNMSLGTQNPDHEPALARAVADLCSKGAVVVAAGEQDGVRWLPGMIPGVWSVTLDWSLPRDDMKVSRDPDGRLSFRASGFPRPIPGVPPENNLKGLSFAVANATGLLAAMMGR